MLTRILYIWLKFVVCSIEGADDKVTLRHPINAPRFVAAVGNEVLQLHAPTLSDATLLEGSVEVATLGKQLPLHKDLTHDIVDIWRVYAMAPKVACALKA